MRIERATAKPRAVPSPGPVLASEVGADPVPVRLGVRAVPLPVPPLDVVVAVAVDVPGFAVVVFGCVALIVKVREPTYCPARTVAV